MPLAEPIVGITRSLESLSVLRSVPEEIVELDEQLEHRVTDVVHGGRDGSAQEAVGRTEFVCQLDELEPDATGLEGGARQFARVPLVRHVIEDAPNHRAEDWRFEFDFLDLIQEEKIDKSLVSSYRALQIPDEMPAGLQSPRRIED